MRGEIIGKHVVLADLPAKEVRAVLDLLKEAGVKNTALTMDYWEEYN
jgi:hypothetical protein